MGQRNASNPDAVLYHQVPLESGRDYPADGDIPWRPSADVPVDGPPPDRLVTPYRPPLRICCWTCKDKHMVQVCGYSLDGGLSVSESEYMDDWYLGGRTRCNVPCPPEEEDKCGLDATKAFIKDMERKLRLTTRSALNLAWGGEVPTDDGIPRLSYEAHQGKYGLSYKWMNANDEKCGSGACVGTVGFGGGCITQNQLGNMGLMMLFAFAHSVSGHAAMFFLDPSIRRLDQLAGIRPDSAAAFAVGLDLYVDLAPTLSGTPGDVQGSIHNEIPDTWLEDRLTDVGWQQLQERLGHIAELLDRLARNNSPTGEGMSPKALSTTSKGKDASVVRCK